MKMIVFSHLMFIPFAVKHNGEEYELSDANFVKRSPKLYAHWYYKRSQSFTVDQAYSKEAVSYVCDYLNDSDKSRKPVSCKDIVEAVLSLGCPNLLVELFKNSEIREAIDCYKHLISIGVISKEYEQMLTKMMNESDDYLEWSSLPIECLARLCRGLSIEKRIELTRAKGGQSACLLLIGIDPNEISPDIMTAIGEIEGWTENKRLSEHYNNEISKLQKEFREKHQQEILKIQEEVRKKDEEMKKMECQNDYLVKLLIEMEANSNAKTDVCIYLHLFEGVSIF